MKTLTKTLLIALIICLLYIPTNAQTKWIKPIVSITGLIIDKTNDQAIGLKIYVSNKNNKKIAEYNSSNIDGSYFITGLRSNKDYILSFISNGIIVKTIKIHTPKIDSYKEIVMDFYVKPSVQKEELQSLKI